jgi:hypothetical protein
LSSAFDFIKNRWGDFANLVGIIVSVVGFIYTIRQVARSKEAAQRAEKAALNVRAKILMTDTVIDLSSAIAIMEEIQRLHRSGSWGQLPDRYSALKRLLISIRTSAPGLQEQHSTALLSSLQHFSDIEKKVEKALDGNTAPLNVPKFNEIVSLQLDRVHEILSVLKQQIGIEEYGGQKNSESSESTD